MAGTEKTVGKEEGFMIPLIAITISFLVFLVLVEHTAKIKSREGKITANPQLR